MSEYEIDQSELLKEAEEAKKAELANVESTYNSMIDKAQGKYNAQIDAVKKSGEEQSKLQQERTDFTIDAINQQRQQAQKEYEKEQSAAYVDWKKQSGAYGVPAEQIAAAGMTGSGYSETAKVNMYTAYQNRVASARESVQSAMRNFDNAITEARLQNSSVLAEIALQTLTKTLSLELESIQYENSMLMEKLSKRASVESAYNQYAEETLGKTEENAGGNGNIIRNPETDKTNVSFTGRTYQQAVAFLKKNGVKQDRIDGLVDQRAWNNSRGTLGSMSDGYGSYQEYLRDYVLYAMTAE